MSVSCRCLLEAGAQAKAVSHLQDAWLNDTPDEDIVQIIKYIANFYNSISAAADPLQVGVQPSCCAPKLLRTQAAAHSWACRQHHQERSSVVSAKGLPVLRHGCSCSALFMLLYGAKSASTGC